MNPLPVIRVEALKHRDAWQLALFFDFNRDLILHCKKLGARWSQGHKCWYILNTPENFKKIFPHFKNIAWIDVRSLKTKKIERIKIRSKREEELLRLKQLVNKEAHGQLEYFRKRMMNMGYSKSTILSYANMLEILCGFTQKDLTGITFEDAQSFQHEYWIENKYSNSTQRQFISALKHAQNFFNFSFDVHVIPLPRKEKKLPKVLSKQEVLSIFKQLTNLKHLALISLLYSAGLRIGEALNLRIKDVDFDRLFIHIRAAKGKKDRYVGLSRHLSSLLQRYLKEYDPLEFVFNGQASIQYQASSVRQLLHKASTKAGIKKRVTPHMMRHSYATHLLESGVDIRVIQELLGHSKTDTTMIYTHVSNRKILDIVNPLDELIDNREYYSNKSNDEPKNMRLSRD